MGGNVPLGYEASGRSLRINPEEAKTIRTLYDLYEKHGNLREVREQAERQQLRSKSRIQPGGKISGGNLLRRGHIYHLLTNPIYAGRIRHKGKVHEGQHQPIIAPERFDDIQSQLQQNAARQRSKALAKRKSLLCGKLYDETGDRLSPSHSKTRKGTRLRYYISHSLIVETGANHPGAWRLPAPELEKQIAACVLKTIRQPRFISSAFAEADTAVLSHAISALREMKNDSKTKELLSLVQRIDIAPGKLTIALDAVALAGRLNVQPDIINPKALVTSHPFQLRKRGVETKIIMAD